MDASPQYCPTAVATEILGDRWTPLILRELIVGSHSFGEIHTGIPHLSRTLLSSRLKQLATNGIIERREELPGHPRYWLTPAGRDLEHLIFGLAEWAIRWAYFGEPADDELNNPHLLWRMGRGVLRERLPDRRVVIEFVLSGPRPAADHLWIVAARDAVETCLKPPGFDTDIEVRTSSREMHRIWLGRTTIADALKEGTLELNGPLPLVRALPRWFAFSPFAPAVRKAMRTAARA